MTIYMIIKNICFLKKKLECLKMWIKQKTGKRKKHPPHVCSFERENKNTGNRYWKTWNKYV